MSNSAQHGSSNNNNGCFDWVEALWLNLKKVACSKSFQIHGNRYKIKKQLAEGGFSFVFLVERNKELYAVKRILVQSEAQLREAKWEINVHRLLGSHSKYLMPLIDSEIAVESGRKQVLLLFPLFEKGSLIDLLLRYADEGNELSERNACEMFLKICYAVEEFHSLEPPLAHRDIKPHNILLTNDNEPVLMDFGSASSARVDISDRNARAILQEKASIQCSMAYRAPELWEPGDDPDCVVDEKTDVWSLGCLFFAMLFGQGFSPFECSFSHQGNSGQLFPNSTTIDLEASSGSNYIPRAKQRDCSYLAVIGDIPFPERHSRSERVVEIIKSTLKVKTKDRITLRQLIDDLKSNTLNVT